MPRKQIPEDERCRACGGTGRRPPMGRPPKLDDAKVARLAEKGWSAIKIAAKFGVHRSVVYDSLARTKQ